MNTATRPTPGPVRPYEFPAVHRNSLANGVRLLVAPMPRLPIVTVLALVDIGAARERSGEEGVAVLTARTLTEGAAGLDGAALAARLEGLGAAIVTEADWDSTVAQFTTTSDRVDAAFRLFAEVVRAPSFPARDVQRLRDERLAEIAQQLAEPRGLADERFDGFLFAPTARYAQATAGSVRSVRDLEHDLVAAFHASSYGPAATTLIFVGDTTPSRAMELADAGFGGWSSGVGGNPVGPRVDAARSGGRRTIVVSKADAPQAELRVGHLGVPRSHPEYLTISVMNAILGGLFSSRINLNLREKNAFTYGASSLFDWRRGAGPFVVSTAVKSEVSGRAVQEIIAEIEGMRQAPPSASELDLATKYLAGIFPIRYETTAAVAAALARATVFGLGDEWFREYRERIRAVTAEGVHAAARAHLDPARLLVLAVGDPSVIEGPLASAGVGAVSVVSADADPTEDSR